MFINRVKKLIVIALCSLFVLPVITFKVNTVNASEHNREDTLYLGVSYMYEISESAIKTATVKEVTITATKEGSSAVEIFKDGNDVSATDDFKVSYATGSSSKDAVVTLLPRAVGTYKIDVSVTKEDATTTDSSLFTIVKDIDVDDITPKYVVTSMEDELIANYKELIEKNIVNNKSTTKKLVAGDTFTVPKINTLVESAIPYDNLKKTVYYSAPNTSTYASKSGSKADLSFNITTYGTYRFYLTCYVERFDKYEEGLSITTTNLEEKVDGFYQISKVTGEKLYAKKTMEVWKYYEDEEYEVEYSGEIAEPKLIIPIFTFTLENAGPTIDIANSYQEDGFVDLKYTVNAITVNGIDVQTTYTLQYTKDIENPDWKVAEEEFDSVNRTFVPKNLGYYRVVVEAMDAVGEKVSAETEAIKVSEKYVSVGYKVSFGDWLKVNVVPFIFLCISASCLIAIICLLVIKPKEKVSKATEEDR